MSRRNRPNQAAALIDSDDENTAPDSQSRRTSHITFTHYTAGSVRTGSQVSYIETDASPQKKRRSEDAITALTSRDNYLYDADTFPLPFQDSYALPTADNDVDPAYTQYKADVNPEQHGHISEKYQYTPLLTWARYDRDDFLKEMLRLEGPADFMRLQCQCGADAEYRCRDCYGGEMFCRQCIMEGHRKHPFHFIERWLNGRFDRVSLKELGFRIQLGHPHGDLCTAPKPAGNGTFVVIHVNGIHDVALDYCGCLKAKTEAVQLLRARLYPATSSLPRTAGTFSAMSLFQTLNFEAKTSAFEFHSTMASLTDNSGSRATKDCYDQLRLMLRTWMNLKLLKRFGRGHDVGGVDGTKDGSLALRCPACPQPERNLPSDWMLASEKWSWIYAQFLAIDANFKTKRKKVSNSEKDPSLSKGWAYFVDELEYKVHLEGAKDVQQDQSSCVNHSAVNNYGVQQKDLAITGTVTVDCGRHDMKRPNGCSTLQAGERYVNVDYPFWVSMEHGQVIRYVVSYDIVCQWHKKLFDRLEIWKYRPRLEMHGQTLYFVYLIPKFHLPTHIELCQILYSFHLKDHVGVTNAEGPERGWANINGIAPQAKEMGPGYWQDTMNNHYGAWNWKKTLRLGVFLLSKLEKALPERLEHLSEFREFNDSLRQQYNTGEWNTLVTDWEAGRTDVNPYQRTTKDPTLHGVRQTLAQREAEEALSEAQLGVTLDAIQTRTSPSEFVSRGLSLEEEQRRIRREHSSLGAHATEKQLADFQLTLNRLQSRIDAFIAQQNILMPDTVRLRDHAQLVRRSDAPALQPYAIPLYLPSDIAHYQSTPIAGRQGGPNASCSEELMSIELRLREGQAYDALNEIRNELRVRSYAYKHKDRYASGSVRDTSRINSTIAKIDSRINSYAATYRIARRALILLPNSSLDPAWSRQLRTLEESDVRGMTEGLPGESTGKKTTSWVWLVEGFARDANDHDTTGMHEALRIEWCRTRARAMRPSEEIELVLEEMRRTLAYFEWEAKEWDRRVLISKDLAEESDYISGFVAYAGRQANQRRKLRDRFREAWHAVPELIRANYAEIKHSDDIGKAEWSEEECCVPHIQEMLNSL